MLSYSDLQFFDEDPEKRAYAAQRRVGAGLRLKPFQDGQHLRRGKHPI